MSQNPPATGNGAGRKRRAAPHAERPPGRSAGARRGARAARRPAAPARSADRASASHPGQLRPSLRRASRGARRRDEAGADRGLRGRDLLRAFRCGEGRRDAAAAGHRARCDSLSCAMAGADNLLADLPGKLGAGRARGARAVHGRVRSRAGLRGRPCAGDARRTADKRRRRGAQERARACAQAAGRFRRLSRGGRLHAARRLPRRASARAKTSSRRVDDAGLRGLGGAGFPTGRKWTLVRAEPARA